MRGDIKLTIEGNIDGIPMQIQDGQMPSVDEPLMDGEAAAGESMRYSREDHVHPSDTSRVPVTRTINGEALSADVVLDSGDIGLLTPIGALTNVDGALTNVNGRVTALENAGYITTETDPTVPSWAKAPAKPEYTAAEVGAVPATRKVNGKALSSDVTLTASDVGAIATETDPTVPSWAKQSTKPSYTASEVGALPASTHIPTVGVTRHTTSGVNIADVTIDGTTTKLYAPEGGGSSVEPATATPLMDGEASVGTSVKYAREDHRHATDQSLVSGLTNIAQGLGQVAQRVTTAENKLAGIEAGAEVNVQADWNQTTTTADDYIKNKPTIPTVPITSISLNGQAVSVDGNKNANIVLTAGDGISITNGVISVNYPNGDVQSF